MEVSGLGALRQYQAAQKALSPEMAPDKSEGANLQTSGLAKGVEEFADVFKNVENTMQAHATGQADAHSVVQAIASAELALETAVTVRNRVVEAYQELLRMPV
ncbi:MAG: flagellar hook-basal body complex protein FliE [Robiginitomaculum sp.]|nr:flagellar hook-basal body complex protein FliE [Robiginitomaculum sp.]